jgi:type II secretory pathway pseudopilin PulG
MKRLSKQAVGGFTRVELVVVVVVIALLGAMLIPAVQKARQKSWRIQCLNNMKEIGTGYRLWAGDHGDALPFQASTTNGGLIELLTKTNAGPYCWKFYAVMGNELTVNPKLLVCPADERQAATNFTTDFKDNTHLSYFVGVNANDVYPQSIAGGDRNLGPGLIPDPNYGYSPTNGQGNDVVLYTNSPVSWSLKMHSRSGNILLGDGSGQQMSSASLRQTWLINAQTGTNSFGTNQFGIRLVFP